MEIHFTLRRQVKNYIVTLEAFDSRFPKGKFSYSTGEIISLEDWKRKASSKSNVGKFGNVVRKSFIGFPKDNRPELQDLLNHLREAAKEWEKMKMKSSSWMRDSLRDYLKGSLKDEQKERIEEKERQVAEQDNTMLSLWRQYLESIKDNVQPSSYTSYNQSYTAFESFVEYKECKSITPANFTVTHLNHFTGWLNTNFKPNTVAKHLKRFRAFIAYLEEIKIQVGFDKKKIKYKERPGLKISLTKEELETIADHQFINDDSSENERLSKVRDLLVLQCATGLRISDLKRVDQNIKGNKIVLDTQKTQTGIEVPITKSARTVLERNNYKMPTLSEQKYREGIKDIYKALWPNNTIQVRDGHKYKTVKVHEEISSHDAVRTFITLSHERGMSVNSIAKVTGKTVKVLLSNYLVESQKVADKEMEEAWNVPTPKLKIAR